ncbi:hypothetical protein CLF_103076 [Clonorchis sinensis]|uniref:Uncharacterized protein n=1 Tax=Clonorchis sinensis TaxID=79923 RepID=G7Y910_CLOSI|nr:hypothetical protein CLF_103076 [Clonorchis sinensis]
MGIKSLKTVMIYVESDSTHPFCDLYIRALAVDKTGGTVRLDYEYDEKWNVEHLLLEARLCAFLEKAFKRGQTLHQLHFKCDFLGERDGDAVISIYFWRSQLAELNVNQESEEFRGELVSIGTTITNMYGLAAITVLGRQQEQLGDLEQQNLAVVEQRAPRGYIGLRYFCFNSFLFDKHTDALEHFKNSFLCSKQTLWIFR